MQVLSCNIIMALFNENSAPIDDLISNPSTQPDELQAIYSENWFNPKIVLAIAKNPNTPLSLLKDIFITCVGGADAVFSNLAMNLLLLENPYLIEEWCQESTRTYYSKAAYKGKLSRNPIEEIQSIELQEIIYQIQDKRIWSHQLCSEYTAPNIYRKILHIMSSEILQDKRLLYTVISNSKCCPEFLHRALTEPCIDSIILAWQHIQTIFGHNTALIEYRYNLSPTEVEAYRWAYDISIKLFEFYNGCKWRHFKYRGRRRLAFGENLLKYIEFRSQVNYKNKTNTNSNILLVFIRNKYVLAIDVDSNEIIFSNATQQEQEFILKQIEVIPIKPRKRRRK
jgi:hypothetical protein